MTADLREFGFSPDGDHFAYVWTNPAARAAGSEKLIVDGKIAPYVGGAPQWTADSQHLFTTVRTGGTHPSVDILLDGKPYIRADFVRMFIPPVGNMNIAQVGKMSGVPTPSTVLMIGGKVVPGSEHPGAGGDNDLTFSADGKHYAAKYNLPNGHQYAFADGKRGQEYTRLDLFHGYREASQQQKIVRFTPDGSPIYVGFNGTAQFVNVNNQEWPQLHSLTEVAISPTGNHVLASGLHQLEVDGKSVSMPDADQIYSLQFSSDGAHMAMAVQSRAGITVFLDGTPQTAFGAVVQNDSVFSFSPDGKHLAYFCRSSNPAAGNDQGVCLDGKYVSVGTTTPQGLLFSNDSNHLFWYKRTPQSGFRAYIDGNPVYDGFIPVVSGFVKETWQTDRTSGLLFLSRDESGFKRVSVTPSAETSLATLVGGATGLAAAHSGN